MICYLAIRSKYAFDVDWPVPNKTYRKKSQFWPILKLLGSSWPLERCRCRIWLHVTLYKCTRLCVSWLKLNRLSDVANDSCTSSTGQEPSLYVSEISQTDQRPIISINLTTSLRRTLSSVCQQNVKRCNKCRKQLENHSSATKTEFRCSLGLLRRRQFRRFQSKRAKRFPGCTSR